VREIPSCIEETKGGLITGGDSRINVCRVYPPTVRFVGVNASKHRSRRERSDPHIARRSAKRHEQSEVRAAMGVAVGRRATLASVSR
jgi:hypothetical protein